MKLYSWQPNGAGQYSFFVIAESQQQAKEFVDNKVVQMKAKGESYECEGWNTDYYTLTISNIGEVIINPNE